MTSDLRAVSIKKLRGTQATVFWLNEAKELPHGFWERMGHLETTGRSMSKKSEIEETLNRDIRAEKLPKPEREYRFAMHHVGAGPNIRARLLKAGLKDWRFDFAYPEVMLAIECEGGIFSGGRHTRGKGYEEDLHKYNAAMMLGWDVCRFSGGMIKSGNAVDFIKTILEMRTDEIVNDK